MRCAALGRNFLLQRDQNLHNPADHGTAQIVYNCQFEPPDQCKSNRFLVFLHCRITIKLAQTGQLIHQFPSSHVSAGCAQAFGARKSFTKTSTSTVWDITTTAYYRCVLTIMGKVPWQPGTNRRPGLLCPGQSDKSQGRNASCTRLSVKALPG